jgi:hypothetical protein
MRKSLTALCLAIAVFVTVVSGMDVPAPVLLLPALWQSVPAFAAATIYVDAARPDEQTSSLRASLAPRPPPRTLYLG